MGEFSREIYSFIEIARESSIRRAAEKLNIASSALSRQMRLLEADFGTRLFDRSATGVRLTEAGRVLLRQSERWIGESNRLRTELGQSATAAATELRLGSMECFAGNLMPDLFRHVRQSRLADRVDVRYGVTDSLCEALQDGQLDLVVAFNAHASQAVRVVSELSCPLGFVCSPLLCDRPGATISVARSLEWPVCLPDKSVSSHARLFAEILKQRGRTDYRAMSNSFGFIRELVLRGECVSFLSWFDVRDLVLEGRLRFAPLEETRLNERLSICVSGARPFTKALAGLAKETLRRLRKLAVIPPQGDRAAAGARPA